MPRWMTKFTEFGCKKLPDSEFEDWTDDREDEEDSEMDRLLWISTPTSSLRSSKRRLRYLE